MTAIFYTNYIKNRDKDSFDLQEEVYRFSWIKKEEEFQFNEISSFSNYNRFYSDPMSNYILNDFEKTVALLNQHPVLSPKILSKL